MMITDQEVVEVTNSLLHTHYKQLDEIPTDKLRRVWLILEIVNRIDAGYTMEHYQKVKCKMCGKMVETVDHAGICPDCPPF
jgi:hypothetical protein